MKCVAEIGGHVQIARRVLEALLAEARRDPRLECCGLLAGSAGRIAELLPARNALASATAFEIAPADLFALFRRIRELNIDHLGIYHSHPDTDNAPSTKDIERAHYPDVAYFIVSPRENAPRPVRAFRIANGRANELEINVG